MLEVAIKVSPEDADMIREALEIAWPNDSVAKMLAAYVSFVTQQTINGAVTDDQLADPTLWVL